MAGKAWQNSKSHSCGADRFRAFARQPSWLAKVGKHVQGLQAVAAIQILGQINLCADQSIICGLQELKIPATAVINSEAAKLDYVAKAGLQSTSGVQPSRILMKRPLLLEGALFPEGV